MKELKISRLLSAMEAPELEIKENNAVSADRIKEMTMMKISSEKRSSHRPVKAVRVALIAAIFAMTLGICAGGYLGFVQHSDPAGVLHSFYDQKSYAKGDRVVEYENYEYEGKTFERATINIPAWERIPFSAELAEKYIYPCVYGVGETMTWKDYTLTVEAMVYDANTNCGLMYYSVENPNGVEGYAVEPNGMVVWPLGEPWYVGFLHPQETFIDEERTTYTEVYLCSYFVKVDEWGDFEIRLGEGDRTGHSEMTMELPGTGLASLCLDGGSVVVTPIGMSVDEKAVGIERGSAIDHIIIRFADGSEYIVEWDDEEKYIVNKAYAVTDSDTRINRMLFNSIVDIDSILEVEIEGKVFRVE